jgi:hypothetical protein
MDNIDRYLFLNEEKRVMMLYIGYNHSDYEEVYDLVSENIKNKFLSGNYKLQLLNAYGQRVTINFTIKGKRLKSEHTYNCHAGCVVWPNGKLKIATPLILDKEIK